MRRVAAALTLLMALSALNVRQANAKPALSRVKRISDQRLAELETLIALDKLKGKLITVPVGVGLDPIKIGRKRSADSALLARLLDTDADADAADAGREATWLLLQRLQRLQHAQRLHGLRRLLPDGRRRPPAPSAGPAEQDE